MKIPPKITFRRIRETEGLEGDIRKRLARLPTYCPTLLGVKVLVELTEQHHRDGNRYRVRIDLTVPDEQIVVRHDASGRPGARGVAADKVRKQDELDPLHRHARVAIREAFEVARRQLQDYTRRRRGATKAHTPPPEGRVVRIFPYEGYGFIESRDGHEVYFDKGSVLGRGFGKLAVGSKVAFVEEKGEKGAQASTVRKA